MIKEAIEKVLSLAPPSFSKFGGLDYSDKALHIIAPPSPDPVCCTTLQGFVDLFIAGLDNVKPDQVLVQIASPISARLVSKVSDLYGARKVWVSCKYPEVETFKFNTWQSPESFIISVQQHFQRAKIENPDGSFAKDLDYVLSVASKITAEHATDHDDDGFAQRVSVRQGVTLKAETILKPLIMLAPYRTFAEIDQVLSQFVFRCRVNDGQVHLALFDGDGGRWKIAATKAIKEWLAPKFGKVPVIS